MKKFVQEKPHIAGFVTFFIVVFVVVFLFLPSFFKQETGEQKNRVLVNKDGREWVLPEGIYTFSVASADENAVKFVKGEIDPPDVHVGDTQTFMIEVSAESGIKSVKAVITTDTKTQEVQLTKDMGDVWRGSWIVEDTHDTRYTTRFVAEDNAGNSDFFDIAWSDACGIALSGNWSMTTNNAGASCTINGVDGVDNGNVAIDANATLTVNGTFVWNAGKSITLSNGGKIVLGAGGSIQQADLYMSDADSDGYPSNSTQYTSSAAGRRRKSALASFSVDCNDGSATMWQYLTGYPDNDGDGVNSPSGSSICSGTSLPVARQSAGSDCDDNDYWSYQEWGGYLDNDGDGIYGSDYGYVCGGSSNPGVSNYPGSDCNDYNPSVSTYITGYYDADNDGRAGNSSNSFCATSLPSRYYSSPTDCNDGNPNVYTYNTFYTDSDGDTYGRPFYYDASYNRITETGTSLCANSPPSGYSSNKSDCNDTDGSVNVGNCLSGSFSGGSAPQGGTAHGQFTHVRYDLSGNPVTYPTLTSSISGLPSGVTCYNYPNCGPSNYYVAAGGEAIHPVDFIIPSNTPIGTYNISITISNNNIGFTGNSESHTYNTTLTVTSGCTSGYQDNDGDGYGRGAQGCYLGSVVSNNNDCDDNYYGRWIGTQRSMYQAQSVACGTACATETQTCQAGGSWSGTYTQSSCSVSVRTAYLNSCGTCTAEGQSCLTNGSWSGTYTNTSCVATCLNTYYRDADGDGYGNPLVTTQASSQPAGYVANSSDCYDSSALARPGGVWQSYARGDGSWDWDCSGVEEHKWCGQLYAIGNAWQSYSNAPYYTSGSSCTYAGTTSGYYTTTYTMTDICGVACGQPTGQSAASTYKYVNSSCSAGSGGQYYSQGSITQQDCK